MSKINKNCTLFVHILCNEGEIKMRKVVPNTERKNKIVTRSGGNKKQNGWKMKRQNM